MATLKSSTQFTGNTRINIDLRLGSMVTLPWGIGPLGISPGVSAPSTFDDGGGAKRSFDPLP
jgi:hypothetical protein